MKIYKTTKINAKNLRNRLDISGELFFNTFQIVSIVVSDQIDSQTEVT